MAYKRYGKIPKHLRPTLEVHEKYKVCEVCGSHRVIKQGLYKQQNGIAQKLQCKDCKSIKSLNFVKAGDDWVTLEALVEVYISMKKNILL